MSLHDLANQVQSAGRNDDKVLVHMTPGEVNGLQSLAMAHGGSLTINPETGLPEASFLRSLLPTLIGFGLAPITGGLSAALITGAGYTAATGSLKKGIMAGLGAYGGAGLAGGLSSMGTAAGAKAGATGANAAQTAITNVADDAANFAGANSNVFSANPAFNTAATAQKSMVFNTPGATPGMTPANLAQARLPQYANVNFATGMKAPAVTTPMTPANRLAVLEGQGHKFVETNPNAFVTTNVPPVSTNAYNQGLLAPNPPPQPWDVASKMPRTSTYAQPERLAQYKNVDFAGGATYAPPQPTSVAAATPAPAPSAYSKYMSQVGEGAKKVYAGGADGVKALYDAMPNYSVAAGVAGPALSYAEEKREKAEEAMRRARDKSPGMIRPYEFSYGATNTSATPYSGSAEQTYFQPTFTARTPYEAPGPEYRKAAEGGLMGLAVGGAVEEMAALNAVGANTGYPMANLQTPMYTNPAMQRPEATNVIAPSADAGVGTFTGEARFAKGGGTVDPQNQSSGYEYSYDPKTMQFVQTGGPTSTSSQSPAGLIPKLLAQAPQTQVPATPNGTVSGGVAAPIVQPTAPARPLVPKIDIPAYQTPEQQLGLGGFYDYMNQQMGSYGGYAAGGNVGGISHLGDYSDGGRLLKGPGDGVSDSIPASIGNRQPARLADGEFVVPARIVSEIGNGSTEAGARKLYAMMDRVQKARRRTVGKNQVARNTKAEKLLPA